MAKSLTFLDKTFWLTESSANPKHVGCIQILTMPEGEDIDEYINSLYQEMQGHSSATSPFNCRVTTFLGYPLGLKPVKAMEMEYHVQLHRINDVHDKIALDDFVACLHETRLDPDKPLWQYHLIYDGKSRQFAMYARVHHMYGDGATLVRWFQASYATEPKKDGFVPIWAMKRLRHKKTGPSGLVKAWQSFVTFIRMIFDLIVIFARLFLKLIRVNSHYMPIPFSGTKTVLTGQVKPGRAVATTTLDFERVKELAKRTRASANEVLLCAFDIGVHRLLQDHGHVFKKSLYTHMPINLRKPGDKSTGNKIAIVPVALAHGQTDPYLRLREIISNHRIVKYAAQHASPAAFSAYTVIIHSFSLVFELLRISDLVKPIANILVSNMPGPTESRYFKDAKLEGLYPVSTITPGGGVNITLITYAGQANIGMVCCNKNIASLQPLVDYFQEAFTMLEASIEDPTLNIDDIGEHEERVPISIVSDMSA